MAGSYNHIVGDDGRFLGPEYHHLDNMGDAYEALEELMGMTWYLADLAMLAMGRGYFTSDLVESARRNYTEGLRIHYAKAQPKRQL